MRKEGIFTLRIADDGHGVQTQLLTHRASMVRKDPNCQDQRFHFIRLLRGAAGENRSRR